MGEISTNGPRFGAFCYTGQNIGDDIQTVAATQYLPRVDIFVNRDLIGFPRVGPPISVICNGWFMHNVAAPWGRRGARRLRETFSSAPWTVRLGKHCVGGLLELPYSWPPSHKIDPLFVSLHICDVGRAKKVITSSRSINYLQRYQPIGCRDFATQALLQEHGVGAYFSGCLTMTLNPRNVTQTNDIYFVDVRGAMHRQEPALKGVPDSIASKIKFVTHQTRLIDREKRLARADEVLDLYAGARLVVTSRLHCALPCLAFGTPVLFVRPDPENPRFSGLVTYLKTCRLEELSDRLSESESKKLLSNPADIAPIARQLRNSCEQFIASRME